MEPVIHCKFDELADPKKLKNHPQNPNKHGQDQIERLVELYKGLGVRHPIIVSKRSGYIVAGHGRKLAAIRAGIKKFPVEYQDFENDDIEYATLVSDNAIKDWAELDMAAINDSLQHLGPDFNLDLLGIQGFTLDMADKEFESDPDEIPEVVETSAKLGQIYQLGEHRLMCGDSTDEQMVSELMNGEKADMVFTSPPYNGNTHLADGDIFENKAKKLYGKGYSDNLSSENYIEFTSSVLENCFLITNGFIFWNVSYNANSRNEYIKQILNRLDFLIEQICWKKAHAVPFKGSLMRQWEPIYIFSTDKKPLGNKEATVNHWEVTNRNVQDKDHKACFPIALPEKAFDLINPKNVADLFGGSGSTLIACEKTNRKCFMMELDPHYVDVIIARWEKFTGKKAELINE